MNQTMAILGALAQRQAAGNQTAGANPPAPFLQNPRNFRQGRPSNC